MSRRGEQEKAFPGEGDKKCHLLIGNLKDLNLNLNLKNAGFEEKAFPGEGDKKVSLINGKPTLLVHCLYQMY